MASGLDYLIEEGIIDEAVTRLKSGKEADVYAVTYGGRRVAAKVYKNHEQRSFKHDTIYREGRRVRNSRVQRAMERGSRYGRDQAEEAWKVAEVNALFQLHAAGVRVPKPVIFIEGVLLMELVTDAAGTPAPRLIDIELGPDQAQRAYNDLLRQLVRMLCCDMIHGDLSPYNVLWSKEGPTIIDLPQIVGASLNSNAERLFMRDAHNILDHLAAIDPRLRGRAGDAWEIWRAHTRRELTPDFVPTGRRRSEQPSAPRRPAQVAGQQRTEPAGGQRRSEGPRAPRGQQPPSRSAPRADGAAPGQHPQRANQQRSNQGESARPGRADSRGAPRKPPTPEVVYVRRPSAAAPATPRDEPESDGTRKR